MSNFDADPRYQSGEHAQQGIPDDSQHEIADIFATVDAIRARTGQPQPEAASVLHMQGDIYEAPYDEQAPGYDNHAVLSLPRERRAGNEDSNPSAVRRVVAAAAVAAVAAGGLWITNRETDETSSQKTIESAANHPSADMEERSTEAYAFHSSLVQDTKDGINKAAAHIPHIAAGDPNLEAAYRQAIDFRTAKVILKYPSHSQSPAPEDRIPAASITDIPLRNSLEGIKYTIDAHDLISSLSTASDQKDIAKVHTQITEEVPAGAEPIKTDALQALECRQAENALAQYGTHLDKPESKKAFDAEIAGITDSTIKQNIAVAVEQIEAIKILQKAYFEEISIDAAKNAALYIGDSKLQARVQAALSANQHRYTGSMSNVIADLEKELDAFKKTNLTYNASVFSQQDKQAAAQASADINSKAFDTAQNAEAMFGHMLAAHNNPNQILSGPGIEQAPNRSEVLDLTGLVATQRVPNLKKKLDEEFLGKNDQAAEFAQFGEVRVKDGEIVLTFQESGVSERLQQQFRGVIKRTEPMLRAAFANGSLSVMRLTLNSSYDPYYSSASREIIMHMANNDPLTVDQLTSGIVHEATHSIFRDYFNGVEVAPEENKQLAKTCYDLQHLTYQSIQDRFSYQPEVFTNLRADAKPEHKAVIDALATSIQKGTLADDLAADPKYASTLANACDYAGDAYSLLMSAKGKGSTTAQIPNSEFDYLLKKESYSKFYQNVARDLEFGSVFSRVINEANYIQTESAIKDDLGHSRDRATELYASLFDAAVIYETQFKANVAKLSDSERAAVMQALQTIVDSGEKRAPTLGPLFERLRVSYNLVR